MSIQRKHIDAVKAEANRLLQRINEMERFAGWHNYDVPGGFATEATSKPQPTDLLNGGQYAAAVKRSSLDLSRALVRLRW